jgi:antitoxin (DNA-binding transcriptional repressor) of toxin-antitoxin stability system
VKRYTAGQARQNFSHLLDAAEKGEPVLIERHGVRFRVRAETGARRARAGRALAIEILHPAVASGQWTWELGAKGLNFRRRRRRR